ERYRRDAPALGARRIGDHGSQRGVSTTRRSQRGATEPRRGLAGHGHARVPARRVELHSNARGQAGPQDRLAGGGGVAPRLDQRRRSAPSRDAPRWEPVRPIVVRDLEGAAFAVNVTPTTIPEVLLIEPRVYTD